MHFDLTSDLTNGQLEALDELKRRVRDDVKEDERKDDALFLRFLRARDYDVDRAEVMLRNHIDWRKKYKIDTLRRDFKRPEVTKYFPMSRLGFDKEGCPVRVLNFGNADIKGLLKSLTKEEAIICVMSYIEEDVEALKKQSQKLGKHLETWTYIFDFENNSLSQATHKPTLQLLAAIFMVYEANYPERLKHAYIINASIYFTFIFAVVKPLLTGNTVSKIKIFGKTGWKEELLNLIHPDVLPAYLGGNRTDPDGNPRCLKSIILGEPVPQSYYFRSPERRLSSQPGVKKYSVSRMSKINIILDVAEPGSHIEWEFETESRDIGFGLYYQEPEAEDMQKKPRELIPKQRVEAHLHCETGMYQCDNPGTYILMFDNSYSWLSQKEIFCRAEVVSPNTKVIEIQN